MQMSRWNVRISLPGFVLAQAGSLLAATPPTPLFASEIAPIIHRHCVECHRPGGVGPFSLISYESVRNRARQITEVTASGFMPPWLPDHTYGPKLQHARGLASGEVGLLRRWVEVGMPEGDPATTPPDPELASGWLLGEPDLVVQLPEPYLVPSDGPDIIRNFVLPIPLAGTTSIRAIDIQGGNPRVLHHAFLQMDSTSASRNRDAADPVAGFDGMDISDAINPEGHFLGWTPGARPYESHPGTEWEIEPGTDLVLQLHFLPSGKPETIQPKVGVYFSPTPPTRKPVSLLLKAKDMDIAPGNPAYRVERAFTTPLPLVVVRVYPHAHYLGKTFELYATLPDGQRQPMLYIPDWNFSWQGDYRFEQPVSLPAGATIVMEWTFDNSDDNPRNPNVPAKRIRYGPGSRDEMAEVAVQALIPEDLDRAPFLAAYAGMQVREDPGNFFAYTNLGLAQAQSGQEAQAEANYRRAIELNPRHAPALNNLGVLLARQGGHARARLLFERALESEPDYLDARHNLAAQLYRTSELPGAVRELRRVVARNPRRIESHLLLGQALRDSGDVGGAYRQLSEVLPHFPADPRLYLLAGECALLADFTADAQKWLQRAVALDGRNFDARYRLGLSYLQAGAADTADEVFTALIAIAPQHGLAQMRLGQIRSRHGREDEAVKHFELAWRAGDARQRSLLLGSLGHHRARGALAIALTRMGEVENARLAFAKAIEGAVAAGDPAYAAKLRELAQLNYISPHSP